MSDQQDVSYRSSAASLFSGLARQSAVITTVCEWCNEPGNESARTVEGFEIPRDHLNCARDARQARVFCVCFEFRGDNRDCPVHGGR